MRAPRTSVIPLLHCGLLALALGASPAAAQVAERGSPLSVAVARGDYATARSALARLSGPERARPDVHYLAGRIAYAEQRYDEATTELERAVAGEPASVSYRLWLARAVMRQAPRASMLRRPRLIRRVRSELEHAHRLAPANAEVRLELVRIYLNAPAALGGDRAAALRLVRELEAVPYFGHWAAAEVARKDDEVGVAERELRLAIGAAPDSIGAREALIALYEGERRAADAAAAWYEKGAAHRRRGQPVLARAAFEAALRRDPGNDAARAALAAPENGP